MLHFRRVLSCLGLLACSIACEAPSRHRHAARPTCEDLERQAADLLRSNQSCTVDADCVAGPSIDCFVLCGSVVNRDADLDELRREGASLSMDYQGLGCACADADCADPADLRRACRGGMCTYVAVE